MHSLFELAEQILRTPALAAEELDCLVAEVLGKATLPPGTRYAEFVEDDLRRVEGWIRSAVKRARVPF